MTESSLDLCSYTRGLCHVCMQCVGGILRVADIAQGPCPCPPRKRHQGLAPSPESVTSPPMFNGMNQTAPQRGAVTKCLCECVCSSKHSSMPPPPKEEPISLSKPKMTSPPVLEVLV
jgi:hypothetical protein